MANRIPAQRHCLFVRPLPFSLSVSTAGKAVYETKPIATPTIKYEIGPLLKDLMEWPSPKKEGYSTRCVPFVRIANIPRTTGRRATKSWQTGPGAGSRSEKSSLDQPSAPTTWYDGHSKTWRMMAHPTQERLCHRGTHGWKQSLWFVLISGGRNNKKKSPGWLVSLVIGDYLAWFGEHLLS